MDGEVVDQTQQLVSSLLAGGRRNSSRGSDAPSAKSQGSPRPFSRCKRAQERVSSGFGRSLQSKPDDPYCWPASTCDMKDK